MTGRTFLTIAEALAIRNLADTVLLQPVEAHDAGLRDLLRFGGGQFPVDTARPRIICQMVPMGGVGG